MEEEAEAEAISISTVQGSGKAPQMTQGAGG